MLYELPENLIEKAVIELKESNYPVFIWGGGQTAKKIKRYMSDRGVKIEGFLLNREFWTVGINEVEGYPLFVLEDYLDKNKCDLIVGFSGYCNEQAQMIQSRVHRLYALDFIGALCLEGQYGMISQKFYRENMPGLQWLEKCLCDEKSKAALDSFIIQRMTGIYMKKEYKFDQYFPNDIISLRDREVFVDCGAYHGESAIDFIMQIRKQKIESYKKIICVEADKYNVIKMRDILKIYKNIEIVSAGLWDRACTLHMDGGLGVGSKISDTGKTSIEAETIDNILRGAEATYIKMDIEGSELKGIQGAVDTIRRYKPKLAICIYHKPEDLIEIPRYICNLRDDYKFYIRNHSPYGIETVLYAI